MHFNTLTFHVCVCIPLRLVLGKCWGLTAAHFQHSVSAENHPQIRPPYSAPAKRTIPTKTQTPTKSVSTQNFTNMIKSSSASCWRRRDVYLRAQGLALYEWGRGISSNPANQRGEQTPISVVTQGILWVWKWKNFNCHCGCLKFSWWKHFTGLYCSSSLSTNVLTVSH